MIPDHEPGYYAVIPSDVRYCKSLPPSAKLLYGELTALAKKKGYCWASDAYFADLYEVDERTVSRWLFALKDEEFIFIETKKNGLKWDRKIWVSQRMFTKRQKCHDDEKEESSSKNALSDSFQRTDENVPFDTTKMSVEEIHCLKEQQQTTSAVVVSPNSGSFELLKAQGFDEKTATSLAKFPLERIERQIRNLKIAWQEANISNPMGWLRNAIESDWNAPEKKADPAVEAAELRRKQLVEREMVKRQCEALFDAYESRFTTKIYFILGDDVLTMRSGDTNFGTPYDSGAVNLLKKFISIEF